MQTGKIKFRPPEEVAEMVLLGVRENRPLVVTDSTRRERFIQSYVDVVLSAFDAAAAFDNRRGQGIVLTKSERPGGRRLDS